MALVVITGRVISDNTGASIEMPVLMSPEGVLRPLIDYCLTVRRSIAWQEKLIRAVKLFLEYLEVNAILGEEEWRLFRNFSNALSNGTMDRKSGEDPSGLYWQGLGMRDANYIISLLSDFFDWLGRNENPRARKFNPQYEGNYYDQKLDRQSYAYRRAKAFLGHAWSGEPRRLGRVTRGELPPKVFPDRPPAFPEDRIEELLFKGFKIAGKYNFRDMAITCLLLGGGLRVCEPFHMFMADVQPHWEDPTVAFVAIHHPKLGIAPNDWRNHTGRRGSRAEYLAEEFGFTPRHLVRGKLHAGWKHPALDRKWYMQVHWFPMAFYGRLFFDIWKRYLEQVAFIDRTHPYAWINLDREPVGGMYTVGSYQKSLQSAVERIGLVYGKTHGTTAHGPRHSYGQRARRGGVNEVIIQRVMHHCSPESQLVYTQPELKEATEALERATRKITSQSEMTTTMPRPALLEGI